MSVSRRALLQVLPAAAALPAAAQEIATANSDADLEAARRSQRASVQAVRQVALSQATEPATRFVPRG